MQHFSTVSVDRNKEMWALDLFSIGAQIQMLEDLTKVMPGDICLIGLHGQTTDAVRSRLYSMALPRCPMYDLGDFQGTDIVKLHHATHAIYERGGIVVFISDQRIDGLFHHMLAKDQDIQNTTIVGRASEDVYRLYDKKHFVTLAHQAHRAQPIQRYKSQNLQFLRLGEFRSYPMDAEPFLRGSQICLFSSQAVRYSDAPASPLPSPSGLTSEEACLLSSYAGQAMDLKLFWIYDYILEYDTRRAHADLMAQCIWYFIEGVSERGDRHPLDRSVMNSYAVALDSLDVPLRFYQSPVTERWWVLDSYESDAQAIPCSERDYQMAKNGHLSHRLLTLLDVYAK